MYSFNEPLDVFLPLTYPKIARDRYVISNNGMIKDIINGCFVKDTIDKWGFATVSLFTNEPGFKIISVRVHRLVAWEFCPENRVFTYGVGHIDDDKLNNYYQNLQWIPTGSKPDKPKNDIPEKFCSDPIAYHIINTYNKNEHKFYNANPAAFLQYIQNHHPDDKVTMQLIKKVIRDYKKAIKSK